MIVWMMTTLRSLDVGVEAATARVRERPSSYASKHTKSEKGNNQSQPTDPNGSTYPVGGVDHE